MITCTRKINAFSDSFANRKLNFLQIFPATLYMVVHEYTRTCNSTMCAHT